MPMDTFHEDFILNLVDYIEDHHLTRKKFCEQSGVSYSTLRNILGGNNVELNTMVKLAKATGVPLKDTPKKLKLVYLLMKEIALWMSSPQFDPDTTTPQIRAILAEHPEIITRYLPALADIIIKS